MSDAIVRWFCAMSEGVVPSTPLRRHPSRGLEGVLGKVQRLEPLQAPFEPPSCPLQAPFKPPTFKPFKLPSSPLQVPFKLPSSPLQAPLKPPSCPLQAASSPFKALQAPFVPALSRLQASFTLKQPRACRKSRFRTDESKHKKHFRLMETNDCD